MITRIFFTLAILTGILLPGQAQHQEQAHPAAYEYANTLLFFAGTTLIVQSGFNLPTFGFEYVHALDPRHRIGIGLIVEGEAGSHVIQKNEDGQVISEVQREGALLVLPVAYLRLFQDLYLYGGYGIELERRENLGLLKVGLEYKLELANPRWEVLPNVSWDHTRLFDGVVYGVSFGYKF